MDISSFQTSLGDGPLNASTVGSAVQKVIEKHQAALAKPGEAVVPPSSSAQVIPPTLAKATPINQSPEVKVDAVLVDPPKDAETIEKDKLTERFGVLARMEQQNVRQRQEIARDRQAIAAEKTRLEGIGSEISTLKARIAEEDALWQGNPLEMMRRKGWSYDKITQLQLNEGRPTPEMVAKQTVQEELKAEKDRQDKLRLEAEEADKVKYQKAFEEKLAEFTQEVQDFYTATENTEAYELINLHDAREVVVATIEEHFQRTKKAGKPQIMGIKQACDLVEKYLEERVEKSTQTKKWAARANSTPASDASKPNGEATPNPTHVPPRTITNNLTSSAQGSRPLSREERIRRAMSVQGATLPK